MNIKEQIQQQLKAAVKQLYSIEIESQIDVPKEQSFGDFASNIAMQIVKEVKKNPMAIAEEIKNELTNKISEVEDITVAAPGFINFKVNKEYFKNVITEVLNKG